MASIPHRTTINAQLLIPRGTIIVPTGPRIQPVDITPFGIDAPNSKVPFPSQNVDATDTARLPQDLTNFIAVGMINAEILSNPNVVLTNAIVGQTFSQTTVFTVSTNPSCLDLGGGTDNIAFPLGCTPGTGQADGPNATAASMTVIFGE
jgi:hypothetical protein